MGGVIDLHQAGLVAELADVGVAAHHGRWLMLHQLPGFCLPQLADEALCLSVRYSEGLQIHQDPQQDHLLPQSPLLVVGPDGWEGTHGSCQVD